MPKSIVADVIITAADTPEIKAIASKAAGAAFVKDSRSFAYINTLSAKY